MRVYKQCVGGLEGQLTCTAPWLGIIWARS